MNTDRSESPSVVALFPAGGHATRLGELPCSKEILPIGETSFFKSSGSLSVACQALLSAYQKAAIQNVFVILRKGKWDIPTYLGNGSKSGLSFAYLIRQYPYGVPFTLDQAFPLIQDKHVALGFPDILFEPDTAFQTMIQRQKETGADVVLGLFPTDTPDKVDMVKSDAEGGVELIDIKPLRTNLKHAWILALWSPVFSQYLHQYVIDKLDEYKGMNSNDIPETHLGDVFQNAITDGLHINSVTFESGKFTDIGTLKHLTALYSGARAD